MKPDKSYRYRVVDVFTSQPLEGNPLAVFPNAKNLSMDLMQKIARELNLSETVFLLPPTRPDCAAKLRIFTPGKEMEFAGHPTAAAESAPKRLTLVVRMTASSSSACAATRTSPSKASGGAVTLPTLRAAAQSAAACRQMAVVMGM